MKTFSRVLLATLVFLSLSGCGPSGLTLAPPRDASGIARAAIAIAAASTRIERPALPDDLADDKTDKGDSGSAPKAADQKPVGKVTVEVWSSGCEACNRCKRDVAGYRGLEFRFVTVPRTETVPILRWHVRGMDWEQTGWTDLPSFIATYNASLKGNP